MSRVSAATDMMSSRRLNCAQSVLTAFSDELGLETSLAARIAGGFGAGMARTGGVCGAVSGAYMVLSLQPYPEISDPRQRLEQVCASIQAFHQSFIELHGSVMCTDLLGFNLSTSDGLAAARSHNLFTSLCPKFVGDAVSIVEHLSIPLS